MQRKRVEHRRARITRRSTFAAAVVAVAGFVAWGTGIAAEPTGGNAALDQGPTRLIGALVDSDGDLVPDEFDNCTQIPNGPQQASNQVDTDRDGYGNACDADYSGAADFEVTTADFSIFLYAFTGSRPNPETDHDGDGETGAADMSIFLAMFQQRRPLGPGLPCAGKALCLP